MSSSISAVVPSRCARRSSAALAAARRDSPDQESVEILITDDGPGIPERFYAKALGAMTTLRPRDEVEGTGMGLANVRKIAAHYGGHIKLSKNDGEYMVEPDHERNIAMAGTYRALFDNMVTGVSKGFEKKNCG